MHNRSRVFGAAAMVLVAAIFFGWVWPLTQQTGSAMQSTNEPGFIFEQTVIDAAPPSGSGCCLDVLALGDLDGDMLPDVMLGSENAGGLFWYRYPDWTRFPVGPGNYTTDGEIADVDGDGDGDIVISSISADRIEWWENNGDPTAPEGWLQHEIGPKFAHDLAVGDLNGDGRVDVVIFRKDDPRQLTWFAAPPDPAQPWQRNEIDQPEGEGLDLGDLDGDGDLDVAAGRYWYENEDGAGLAWTKQEITSDWGSDCRVITADMNGDGQLDIVLSHSEGQGRLAWFEAPGWTEHVIDAEALEGAHSLEAGDFDGDGDLDVFAGEMHFTGQKRVMVYTNQGGGTEWSRQVLATTGTHNARIADLGGDGRVDIVGKNFDGPKVVEFWENKTPLPHPALDFWQYIEVDQSRQRYSADVSYFGLTTGDWNGDGQGDIASGKYVYLSPGGDLSGEWKRTELPINADIVLSLDVDGDEHADLIAEALPAVYWIEAKDSQLSGFTVTEVASIPATTHQNGQGYTLAQLTAGGRPEILLAAGPNDNEIYSISVPEDPKAGGWPQVRITSEATDEGIGVGDLDGDGDLDLAAGDMHTGGQFIAWFENPNDGSPDWEKHRLGAFEGVWPDRVVIVDLNGDRRLDVLVSEENGGGQPDASVYWYEQPEDPLSPDWPVHNITTQYTTNGMDAADLDGDGDIDVVTGEHRGDKRVVIWENHGDGLAWTPHQVSTGKESHLGARLADLDGDGDQEMISIAWDDYAYLHLWRNDGRLPAAAPTPVSGCGR